MCTNGSPHIARIVCLSRCIKIAGSHGKTGRTEASWLDGRSLAGNARRWCQPSLPPQTLTPLCDVASRPFTMTTGRCSGWRQLPRLSCVCSGNTKCADPCVERIHISQVRDNTTSAFLALVPLHCCFRARLTSLRRGSMGWHVLLVIVMSVCSAAQVSSTALFRLPVRRVDAKLPLLPRHLQVFDTADVYGPFTKYAYVCVGGIHEQLMQCDVAVRFVGRG